MSQREWVQFVKDAKVPIPITEINDVFRRVDRAEKAEKAKDPKAKADKQMNLAEFLEALVRTAAKLMNTSKGGKQALKDGQLGEGFDKLILTYVLPLGEKDSMSEWRLALESEEIKALYEAHHSALYERFSGAISPYLRTPPRASTHLLTSRTFHGLRQTSSRRRRQTRPARASQGLARTRGRRRPRAPRQRPTPRRIRRPPPRARSSMGRRRSCATLKRPNCSSI